MIIIIIKVVRVVRGDVGLGTGGVEKAIFSEHVSFNQLRDFVTRRN